MKKYLVVTNIWGDFRDSFDKCWKHYLDEEREYFDTKEEVDEYVNLFEGVCSNIKPPKFINKNDAIFKRNDERLWGYVIADTERNEVIKWGGHCLRDIKQSYNGTRYMCHQLTNKNNDKINKLIIKDYLFRGKDEIPQNYRWDNGEYEGWLQFRWCDGKNSIDYVNTSPKINKNKKPINNIDFDNFSDEIEDYFARKEEEERIKILADRW